MTTEMNCDVCGGTIGANGKCKLCGWIRDTHSLIYPNAANPPNFVSLNEAKEMYAAGKKLIPDYIQMTELIGRGLDMSFKYKGKKFLIEMHETFTIWEMETEIYWEYATIDDLRENAAIDGVKLRDIWDKVSYIRYEC